MDIWLEMIMKQLFSYATAKSLYVKAQHPRVYFSAQDLKVLKTRVKRGKEKKIMQALREKAEYLMGIIGNHDDLKALLKGWNRNWHQPGTYVVFGMADLAMVAIIDDNKEMIEALIKIMACGQAIDKDMSGDFELSFAASASRPLAMVFDMMYEYLASGDRRCIANWLYEYSIRPFVDTVNENYHFENAANNGRAGRLFNAWIAALAIKGEKGVPKDLGEEILLKSLEATLHAAWGIDGYPEEDIGYGTSMSGQASEVVEALRRAGIYDVYTQCPRYAKIGHALLHFVQPWGAHLSNTGDHGDDFGKRELVLSRLAQENSDPALWWMLGNLSYGMGNIHPEDKNEVFYREAELKKGFQVPTSLFSLLMCESWGVPQKPKASRPTAFRDRHRGIVSFRSGWRDDDALVIFDGSQRKAVGVGHGHASCGHFSLSALGEYFSIDTGRYNIEQDAHSVVLIGGKSARSTKGEWRALPQSGRLEQYRTGTFVDYASSDSAAQHHCQKAKRHLFLVKGDEVPAYTVVIDDVYPEEASEFWWQLQSSPENRIAVHKHRATITGWRHGNLLDVFPFMLNRYMKSGVSSYEITQDVAKVSSNKAILQKRGGSAKATASFGRPSDMLHGPVYERPRLVTKFRGGGRFMNVLIPRRKGAAVAKLKSLECFDGVFAVEIDFGHVLDTFIFSFENGLLEAGAVVARGQWCVVRRNGQKVVRHEMMDGESLRVGPQVLF